MRPIRAGSPPAGAAAVGATILLLLATLGLHRYSFVDSGLAAPPSRGLTVVLNLHQQPAGKSPDESHSPNKWQSTAIAPPALAPTTDQLPKNESTSASSSSSSVKRRRRSVTIVPIGQNCTCSADQSLKCVGKKVHLIEEAVGAICPMKTDIRDIRRESHCLVEAVSSVLGWTRPPPVPRSSDIVNGAECPEHLLEPSLAEQPRQRHLELVHKARRQKAAASLMAAIVSASATMDLWWATGREDMFYDQANMWWLRGWEKGRRHIDPFTKVSVPFLPARAPKADRHSWGSCAVVGNSGVLMKHSLGDEITAHDTVIRVNQGPLHEDYHNHIGNRTDVRILNRKLTEQFANNPDYYGHLYRETNTTVVATRAATWAFNHLARRLRRDHPDKRLLFSSGGVVGHGYGLLASFRAGFEEATGIKFRGGNSPSSGMVAIMIASQMCSKVSLYGFALGNCLRGCPRYHYWTKGKAHDGNVGTAYKGHQYDVEGWLLKALHVIGHVKVSPQPPKYLPEFDSRLGGLISPQGVFTDEAVLHKQKTLLNADVFLDTVLGGFTNKKTAASSSRRKPFGSRGSWRRQHHGMAR